MNTGILIVFGVIAVTLYLFFTELLPIDVTAIGVMITLILLEPWTAVGLEDGFQGFANPATLTILAMFMLSEGIRRTGAVQVLIRWIESKTGNSEGKSLLSLFFLAGPTSGFINNTPVVAILIPVARKLARNVGVSPSRFLIPLSYISILGGTLTLIGTSTNLIASEMSSRLIGRPFSMFEFTHLGVLLLIAGGAYLFVFGRYVIPDRVKAEENLVEEFQMEDYLTDVVVLEGSDLVGKTIYEMTHDKSIDMDVSQVIRNGRSLRGNIEQHTIESGDVLVVRASKEMLKQLIEATHLEIHGNEKEGLPGHIEEEAKPVSTNPAEELERGLTLAEIVLLPTCPLIGQSVRQARFREQFRATVLALRRGGSVIRERMKDLELKAGDTLLIQAGPTSVDQIAETQGFVVTGTEALERSRTGRIPFALLIMAGVILLPTLNIIPIQLSAFCGVFTMILTGCLRMREAYEAVSWDVIFLLAGILPLGIAMENTGADRMLANLILTGKPYLSTAGMLFLLYLITVILTNIISNAAAVILMIPIAVNVAGATGANPFSFIILVTLGSATAFMTPIGYQTNLMVYGPGGYKFSDFARAGFGLQLLTGLLLVAGTLLFW